MISQTILISLGLYFVNCTRIKVWVSNTDRTQLLSPQADVYFTLDNFLNKYVVDVDNSVKFQEMDGYGASLTDSSAWLIQFKMNPSQREELLQDLFNASKGIGLNVLRQPMGACDFSLQNYSYDDTCCDLKDFNINYDKKYIIPLLKRIKQINPNLLIIGTPWSPPAWMKTGGRLIGGKLKKNHYQDLADYFVKYIKEYENEGLPIYAVTIQNEPRFQPEGYPGMLMDPKNQINFLKNNLGPSFFKNGLKTKILIWDHNWDGYDYPLEVLSDSDAKKYVAGTAFHCYNGDVDDQTKVKTAHSDKEIWQTECSDGEWVNGGDFGTLLRGVVSDQIIGGARNWGKSVVKWNLALDQDNGPKNGGCQTCFGTVKIYPANGKYTRNPEYYSSGHASKFVRKDARRIQSTSQRNSLESVAFQNRDGSVVLIMINSNDKTIDFKVRQGVHSFNYNLESGSVATFTWSEPPSIAKSAFSQIEAEAFTSNSGGKLESCDDESGCGWDVGYTTKGTYLFYKNVDFGDIGANKFAIRMATDSREVGNIEIRQGSVNGNVIASITVERTGGWNNWVTKTAFTSYEIKGIQDIYVIFGKSINVNWFRFYETRLLSGIKYKVISKLSGKVLDVKDKLISQGTPIQQWDYYSTDNQFFNFILIENNEYEILNVDSGKPLTISQKENSALVKLGNGSRGEKGRRWKIEEVKAGYFKIINLYGGKSLDVKDKNPNNGALIQMWDYYEGDGQHWVLVPV